MNPMSDFAEHKPENRQGASLTVLLAIFVYQVFHFSQQMENIPIARPSTETLTEEIQINYWGKREKFGTLFSDYIYFTFLPNSFSFK